MELCSPNMSESGGSLVQVKQLPAHGAPLCRLQANGHHTQAQLGHQPWVNHSAPAAASGPAPVHRRGRRNNGAAPSDCSGQECPALRLAQEAAPVLVLASGKVLVTGGGGYLGSRLGRELAAQGMSVVLVDINEASCDVPDGAVYHQSDIREYSSLSKLCEGVECIFHTASYGMSGPEQLRKEQVESVNVEGTRNVIKVCKEWSIPRLVYTSTVNVVFTGRPMVECDEDSVPYVPPAVHIDHYSRTKAIAEQMVVSANGCSLKDGDLLRTCVLRPSGIYGPDERRHLHRVMLNVERRLFTFRFGDPQARMNWVHVDNLVTAHVLAAKALTAGRNHVSSGQVYFINDGVSVNVFEWLTPLFKNLGYSRPLITLPVTVVCLAAQLVEYLHVLLRPIVDVPLLFTQSEVERKWKDGCRDEVLWEIVIDLRVRSITVNHTFNIDKARRELGYCPRPYNLMDCVDQYLRTRPHRSSRLSLYQLSGPFALLLMIGLCLLLLILVCRD